MPLFEVDGQRPLLVQSGRSQVTREPGVGTTAHAVVESHIDGLLGEQIFPVAPGAGPDEPHLLALDATGSPVVVELVAELDRSALTKALDHAGAAGRLTRGELASRYHGGASAFHRDVAAFYDSVPITRSQPGRSSARLIMICQEADEEILNAVDFLRQPTMPVEVLKMGVVQSADGRRFVDVSPLVIHPASSATSPQLSATTGAPSTPGVTGDRATPSTPAADTPASSDVEPEIFAEGVAVGLALGGKMPAEARGHAAPAQVAPTRAGRRRAADAAAPPTPPALPLPVDPGAGAPREALPTSLPGGGTTTRRSAPVRRRSRAERFAAAEQAAEQAPTYEPVASDAGLDSWSDHGTPPVPLPPPGSGAGPGLGEAFAAVAAPAFDRPAPSSWSRPEPPIPEPRWSGAEDDLPRLQVPPLEPPRLSVPPQDDDRPWEDDTLPRAPSRRYDAPSYDPPSFGSPSYDGRSYGAPSYDAPSYDAPSYDAPSYDAPSYDPLTAPADAWSPEPSGAPVAPDDEIDPDLIALASTIGYPTPVVWSRPRRRQHYEAVLHPDGAIELTDGSRYRHPDHAATAASGSPTVDGWTVWRLGSDGPTLMEAFRQRFA